MNATNIVRDVSFGKDVVYHNFVNLYGCEIGDYTKIGAFVEIQKGAFVGRNCKISSHSFVCQGVRIEDDVFIGHGVMFINDKHPRATTDTGVMQSCADWTVVGTIVKKGASIGTGATIICGVTIGERAFVGAGAVVTKDVAPNTTVVGNPAQQIDSAPQTSVQQNNTEVKFLDLRAQFPQIRKEIEKKVTTVIDNAAFVSGEHVRSFEEDFAQYCGTRHAVAVSSGTDALLVSLLALGIGHGDEVLVPVNTFIATAEAVSLCGARPVFVDIDPDTHLSTATMYERAIRHNTKAIIPVHLYGQCADMDAINVLAQSRGLVVLEDACQAHGARYNGKRAGSLGLCAAFSFYPGKNLGAWGEGGAITTDDESIAHRARLLRDHGSEKKYLHKVRGGNFRMNEFQGVVLGTKLPHLDGWNTKRRERAKQYLSLLRNSPVRLPRIEVHNVHVWHLFVVRVERRDNVILQLRESGIGVGIHYPVPLHLTEAYRHLGYTAGQFPIAEKVQSEILSLPMYAELPADHVERVVEVLHSAIKPW